MNNPIIVTDKTLTYYDYKLKGYIGSLFGCDMTVEWEPMENGKNYFKLKIALKNKQGDELFSKIVDFPLEQTIVSGEYNNKDKSLILYFQDGSSTDIPIEDLIEGLASKLDLEKKANLGENQVIIGNDYSVDIPTNSAPYAQISKIGGMSRKCTNLIPFPYANEGGTVNGVTYTINTDGSIAVSGTPTERTSIPLTSLFDVEKAKYFISLQGSFSNMYIVWDLFVDGNRNSQSYQTAYALDYTNINGEIQLRIGLMPKEVGVEVSGICKPMLNRGETALPYEPYFDGLRDAKVTELITSVGGRISIPNSVQSLDSYGCGINSSLYNYIDFESKKFNRVVKAVDLGTLNWTYNTVWGAFSSNALSPLGKLYPGRLGTELCSKYTTVPNNQISTTGADKTICIGIDSIVWVIDRSYTDANAFKSAMRGVMLVYELATPTTEDIDISDIIGVEGNGTLTFENEYGYNVPYEIEYTLDSNDVIGAKEFVGNLKGTAEVAKYYDINGSASAQTIGEALTQLLGAGNPIKITTESIGQLSTTQVLTGISANIITNPPVAINDIILDRYLDGDAAYLCFWLVTNVSGGSTDSTMTLQGAGNIYVGGGNSSIADRAISDGNGKNIAETYETKANATSNKTELQTNIDTVDAARQLNTTDITNIKNGTTPVGKANYANNPSGNLDVTITNILTDLAKAVTRDNLNTDYFNVVNDLIKVIKADSAVYASGNESAGTIDDRIRNAESLATTAKSEATIAATSASQLATQLIARAECTYAPNYSQGGAMALKLTLYTKTNQAIEVSGFQSAIDNYFADILN